MKHWMSGEERGSGKVETRHSESRCLFYPRWKHHPDWVKKISFLLALDACISFFNKENSNNMICSSSNFLLCLYYLKGYTVSTLSIQSLEHFLYIRVELTSPTSYTESARIQQQLLARLPHCWQGGLKKEPCTPYELSVLLSLFKATLAWPHPHVQKWKERHNVFSLSSSISHTKAKDNHNSCTLVILRIAPCLFLWYKFSHRGQRGGRTMAFSHIPACQREGCKSNHSTVTVW